ncbi:MAG: DUF58 domain-containing protein [Pseudomonadota bacterium]
MTTPSGAPARMRRQLTGRGRGLVALGLLLGGAALWTANNQLFLVLGALGALLALDLVLGAWNLRGLQVARRLPPELYAGCRGLGHLLLCNRRRGLAAAALRLGERDCGEAAAEVAWVGPGGEIEVPVAWRFPSRGAYQLCGIELSSRFPFGLLEHALLLPRPAEVLVWPAPVSRHGADQRATSGSHRADDRRWDPRRGGTGDFLDLRDYAPGDSPRQIHWPTSARLGRPMVVVRGREADEQVLVTLPEEEDPVRWERAIGDACGQVVQHVRRGHAVGLAVGPRTWPARRGSGQLRVLLTVLALLPRVEEPQP